MTRDDTKLVLTNIRFTIIIGVLNIIIAWDNGDNFTPGSGGNFSSSHQQSDTTITIEPSITTPYCCNFGLVIDLSESKDKIIRNKATTR